MMLWSDAAWPQSRPGPLDWQENTMNARGWSPEHMIEPYRLAASGMLFAGALSLAIGYGVIKTMWGVKS